MSSRHRRRRSGASQTESTNKTLVWIGVGTVLGLAALFGLSRLAIQEPEASTGSPVVDQQLDDSIDSWFDYADEDEANRRRRKKAQRERRRRKAATEAAAAKKQREDERLAKLSRERRAAERARRTRPSKPVSNAPPPPIELTEAERLAIARDVLGKADTLETTPRETALAGDPTGLGTSRPATNAVDPSQLFSLLVMGSLGGQTIPRDDPQTWARLGYFLQIEAARRFFLVHPDGSIKSILPKGYTGNPPPTPSAGGEPEYRLVIRASAQQGRSIRFYGKQLANTYSCTIQCTIEQRRGGKYFAIDGIPITEQFTPTKPVPQAQILRTAYDMALQKLAAGLQSRQFFQSRA